MIGILPVGYHEPINKGVTITLSLGTHSTIVLGTSELRLLPDDPGAPFQLRSVIVGGDLVLDGEVPLWRLPSFVFTGVRPGIEVKAQFVALANAPGLRCSWLTTRKNEDTYGAYAMPYVPRPDARFEPVTRDAIEAIVRDVLSSLPSRE